ncbi:2-keto-4-pentenoate hydratase [Pseudonocardia xinjiangensis]|uniref:2-keto-4-pentenoate hydratase n=1 Tax=Pseudonocardia xinjiangensis TaxID=75289 RepID=UPI003D92E085
MSSAPGPARAAIIEAAAQRLQLAVDAGTPCDPVRDLLGETDVDLAYAVQELLVREQIAGGAVISGRKIGLTSEAIQQQIGVDQPDFGVLFADMDVSALDQVPYGRLLQPRVEAEVAFCLGADLDGTDLDLPRVRGAVAWAAAALEIVDSRVAGWDIRITDTVADNASSGLYVVSDRRLSLDEVEPREVMMTMAVDGSTVSEGTGAMCLGDPLEALLWLARTAQNYGNPLRAGQLVLSGALGPMAPVPPGAAVHADLTMLGRVSVRFTREKGR